MLHLREEDISHVRPLGEIGLDSLMALELVMNLEECFGIHVPLSGSSGGMTISDIADEIIAHVGFDRDQDDAMVTTLAEQHRRDDIEPGHLETLKGMMNEKAAQREEVASIEQGIGADWEAKRASVCSRASLPCASPRRKT